MKMKDVSVTSRRSIKVGQEFMTFECMLHAEVVPDKWEDEIKALWEKAHIQVDDQIQDALEV